MRSGSIFYAVLMTALVTGCATYRPILDENPKFEKVGEARAEADIDLCLGKADRYLEKHKGDRMRKDAGRGAIAGTAIGGAVGLLSGGLDGALLGAAGGAAVGAASGAGQHAFKDKLTPDDLKQRYVSRCLARKGYDVIGWK